MEQLTNEFKAQQFADLKHNRSSYAWNVAYDSYLAALLTEQNFCKPDVSGALPQTEVELHSYANQVWNRAVEATLSDANNLHNVQPYLDIKVPFVYKKFKRQ
jgi:hypothetical protein